MGGALLATTDGSEFGQKLPLNLDMNLTFMRMVPLAPITAKGRVVKHGARVAFLEGELFDAEGNMLARATSTAIPTDLPE